MAHASIRVVAAAVVLQAAGMVLADQVTLSNGDTLRGEILERDDAKLVLGHPVLGRLTLPAERVTAAIEDDDDGGWSTSAAAQAPAGAKPATAAEVVEDTKKEAVEGVAAGSTPSATDAAAEAPALAPRPGLFGTDLLAGWNRSFEFGATGSEGNTEELTLRTALNLGYEDERDRWKASAVYNRSQSSGTTNRNEFTAEVLKDWLIPDENYFFFANGKYEYDQFQAWDHRVSAFGGIGYQFIKKEKWDLLGRAGVGGNYEFGDVNEFTPEALLGMEFNYRFNDNHKIAAYTTFYPALDPFFSEFRNISGVAYQVVIDRNYGMSLKLGVENEYESDVAEGEEENDLKYYASLVWDF